MSELTFCKSFLTALDARPIKLSSDHMADARQYPAQGAYTLPRLPHPPHPQRPSPKSSNASSTTTPSISLKPMKPPHPTLTLATLDVNKTSIFDLKTQYASHTSIPAPKIKILYKKKPIADSKTVAEVVGADAGLEVEFGVMVMGGATAVVGGATPVASPAATTPSEGEKGLAGTEEVPAPVAQGSSGKEVVATREFWGDLKNFVMQRTRDEVEAERLVGVFRRAWESDK
ncbi:cell-cycle control medial ring component [Phaeosphaeriaceae sp. PMI808]|nr:cell-cycle control medial ring component [Phaeosphaeriaceae sp. PMI808]